MYVNWKTGTTVGKQYSEQTVKYETLFTTETNKHDLELTFSFLVLLDLLE